MAIPITLVGSGGVPIVEHTAAEPRTPATNGPPYTLVASGAVPVTLVDDDLTAWSGALLKEDGNYLLLEAGDFLLLE